MTDYIRPATLEEALRARAEHPDFMVLCGGTDLLVAANKQPEPRGMIDIFGLAPLVGVSEREDGAIGIGAATTYTDLLASESIRRELPLLASAAREIGALQIQSRGTLGGNIATSSPVGDSLPVLLALNATIEVASVSGRRLVPYAEFCTGYRAIDLGPGELIVAVHIPPRAPGLVQCWRKVGTRRAQSISKIMLAATARVDGGRIAEVRIGLGAVAALPVRARATEAAVLGKAPGSDASAAARAALATEITPIDDIRSTARYRLTVAQNLVAGFITALAQS
jgi:CO/xanthine dehydrogenase FAD-binding subunit